jgi:hypothetical protein
MMMRRLLPFALGAVFALSACSESPAPAANAATAPAPSVYDAPVLQSIDAYEAEARAVSEALARNAAATDVVARVERLLTLAEAITPAFNARHPACTAYLTAAAGVRTRWRELGAETLERDYHDDGALPTAGIVPACYHMKDLIVHPASAAALVTQPAPDYAAAKHEIDEVIAHVSVVRGG